MITSLGGQWAGYSTVCPCFVVTGNKTFSHILWFWHCDHVTRGRGSLLQYCVPMFCGHRPQDFSHILWFWHCDHVTSGRGSWLQYCVAMFCGHRPQKFSHILWFWHCGHVTAGRGSLLQYCVTMFCGHRPQNIFLISNGSGIVITSLQEEGSCYSTVCPCFVVLLLILVMSDDGYDINEPPHDKTNKRTVHPAKTDQPRHPPSLISLPYPPEESLVPKLHVPIKRTAKTLIKLGGIQGLAEYSLDVNDTLLVLSCGGSIFWKWNSLEIF